MRILFCVSLILCAFSVSGQNMVYSAVKIGGNEWMKENLTVETFLTGDSISKANSAEEWIAANKEKKAAWCFYNFSEEDGKKYGKLYNWYALTDQRGLAPKGWRLPKETDFENFDKIYKYKAGLKLKSTTGWNTWESIDANGVKKTNSANGDNTSGFTGLPGGCVDNNGLFFHKGINGYFWTISEKDNISAIHRALKNNEVFVFNFANKGFGYSVRCVK
jgi:uncharacterized protein (TIGR02145 family)